ncbi:MAG: aldehyde ferredoxin oxidoreductase family protein [Chloroflexota bacterium]
MYGYSGRILRVNLTTETIVNEPLSQTLIDNFIGGAGTASKILFDEVPPKTEPLGPHNKLIFMTGPFGGTPVPAGSRFEVVFKSPQTNAYGEANSGGRWGAELKFAGFDGLIIEGSSSSPKVLVLTSDSASLQNAGHLWGQDVLKAEQSLTKELGGGFRFISIGPAGENLVAFAALINDGGRSAARTGPGAVMGSKKLKAIAVHGDKKPQVADQAKLKEINEIFIKKLQETRRGLAANGTIGAFFLYPGYGLVKNWQMDISEWPERNNIAPAVLNEKYLTSKFACFACPIGCGRIVRHPVDDSPIHGVEFESAAMLGSQCCLADMEGLILANHLCNTLGLDTISTGGIIAFTMECYERGLIPNHILEGRSIHWGDKEAMLKLIEDIAFRRTALGNLLASGMKHAAEVLGKEAWSFATQVKGVETSAHDPRSCQCWGLGYATGSAGARHSEAPVWPEFVGIPAPSLGLQPLDRTKVEGKSRALKIIQDYVSSAMNSCGCCNLAYGVEAETILRYLEAVTGHTRSIDELLLCGERSFNLKRAFNGLAGVGRKDDVLPERFTRYALKTGVSKGLLARVDEMLDEYYRLRGWDSVTGLPTKEKLAELALPKVSKALYGT